MNLVIIDDDNGCDCRKDGSRAIAAVGIWYVETLFFSYCELNLFLFTIQLI